jgi:hypothetical protein
MKIIFSFVLLSSFILSGCAGVFVPPMPSVQLPPDAKIGVYVNASQYPMHTHIGTTIFNNDAKEYPYDWQMQSTLFDITKTEIEKNTVFSVVDLSAMSADEMLKHNFVEVKDKKWNLVASNNELRQHLLEQGIYAVIIINEAKTLAQLNCSQYGCTEFYSQGYGLFTRSFFGMDTYLASASFNISAELLDPAIDLAIVKALRDETHFLKKHTELKTFADPKDFENITAEEMAPVKQGIEKYISNIVGIIATYLKGDFSETNKRR